MGEALFMGVSRQRINEARSTLDEAVSER